MSYTAPTADTDVTYQNQNNLMRLSLPNVGMTRISPLVDSKYYGPDWLLGRFTVSVADNDANKVLLCGIDYGRSANGVFITSNALATNPTWVSLIAPAPGVVYQRCALVNNGTEAYFFGSGGAIAYSANPYNPSALDNRIGNLSTAASVVGIAGF
jgi:hypothetical protein